MRYYIEMVDGLYCVYRREKIGDRIISAYHTLKEAKEAIMTNRKEQNNG